MASWEITALEGYSIDTVSLNGSVAADFFKKQESYTLKKPCLEPISIDITSSNNLVTITALECENGEIVGDIGTFIKGKGVLRLEAKPDEGYYFSSWSGADFAEQNVILDTAEAENSYTLSAVFEKYSYKITVTTLGKGYVEKSADYVDYGGSVTLTAIPDYGYFFDRWRYQYELKHENPLTISNIQGDVTEEAWFLPNQVEVALIVQSPDGNVGGMIEVTDYSIPQFEDKWQYGGELTIVATPAEGYRFIKWSDGVSTSVRNFLVPASDTSLTAYFRRYEYDVDIAAENHGKIELTTGGATTEGKATAKHFDNVLLKITPDFGWRVSEILLDGVPITAQATITRHEARYTLECVDKAHGFEVRFEPKMYTNGRKLIDYYPPVIASIKDMQQIVGSQQPMIEELWDAVSFVTENQFIDSSTEEGVKEWEDELGIVPAANDTFEQRKKRLKNRWVPDNRFTLPWLWEWLKRVSERDDIKIPTVTDYVLTVRLPAIVDYFTILNELEMYKPANIGVNAQISLEDGTQKLTSGVGIVSKFKIKLGREALESGN